VKVVNLANPVTSEWLADQGFRLDPAPYLSGALEARKLLERLPNTVALASVTAGYNGGIFNGPIFRRVYLPDPEHSVPFLGSKDMMTSDLTKLPRLRKSDAMSRALSYLQLKPGMTLISCSGFNSGRRSYVRPDMVDIWSSQDVLKVEADPNRIKAGYLYAFLASRYGEALVKGSAYGTSIKHIEPHHLVGLPVPRFNSELEAQIHDLIEESAHLRADFQAGLTAATEDLFKSVNLTELIDPRWHQQERDLGFEVEGVESTSLRALNFAPRALRLVEQLGSVPGRTLGEICVGGQLSRGIRFKRIDSDPEHGVQLVGQRQAFWLHPEGRWIGTAATPDEVFAEDETILVAARGTLGENEVYGRAILATGSWTQYAYSEDFLRVVSGDPEIPGAYLFAFFRSEAAFRLLRSMSAGGKQQDIHETLRAKIPIPLAAPDDRHRIAETVRLAHRNRDRAYVLEDQAFALVTKAIEEATA
jgi:type I restriction enzyme S subunit